MGQNAIHSVLNSLGFSWLDKVICTPALLLLKSSWFVSGRPVAWQRKIHQSVEISVKSSLAMKRHEETSRGFGQCSPPDLGSVGVAALCCGYGHSCLLDSQGQNPSSTFGLLSPSKWFGKAWIWYLPFSYIFSMIWHGSRFQCTFFVILLAQDACTVSVTTSTASAPCPLNWPPPLWSPWQLAFVTAARWLRKVCCCASATTATRSLCAWHDNCLISFDN